MTSRDPRFVAVHRGGLLDLESHRLLALWAADCAEHVIHLFESARPDDERPRRAIDAARAWARGEIGVGEARAAAVAAHSAARAASDPAAREAARAAGHAAATAHMGDHCLGPSYYGVKAARVDGGDSGGERERTWQHEQLPEAVRELVLSAEQQRAGFR